MKYQMNWKCYLDTEAQASVEQMDYQVMVAVATPDCDITNFPHALITVRTGIVVKQIELLDNPNCSIPDMLGWHVNDLINWVNNDDVPGPLNMVAWR